MKYVNKDIALIPKKPFYLNKKHKMVKKLTELCKLNGFDYNPETDKLYRVIIENNKDSMYYFPEKLLPYKEGECNIIVINNDISLVVTANQLNSKFSELGAYENVRYWINKNKI